MRDKPVYLNLFAFAFPVTAIVSILHRLSGLLLFFCIPPSLILLQNFYFSSASFADTYAVITRLEWLTFLVWLGLSGLIYHLLAGIRHLVMDLGVGESKKAARISSYLVLGLSVLLSFILGHCLWFR